MKYPKLALITITLVAGFLRFYNLMWGNGFFFHPDERNMAASISQLCLSLARVTPAELFQPRAAGSCSMNPHFFAYGAFPLYLAYFSHQIFSLLTSAATFFLSHLPFLTSHFQPRASSLEPRAALFPDAVFWLRFWSALSSTLTIPLIFLIARKLLTFNFALLTATLVAFTPGLIQAAHFGTTESLLTFFFMLILYLSLKVLSNKRSESGYGDDARIDARSLNFVTAKRNGTPRGVSHRGGLPNPNRTSIILLGVALGLSLATKLTAIYFLIPAIFPLFLILKPKKIHNNFTSGRRSLMQVFLFLFVALVSFFLASPYNFLDFQAFLNTSLYETKVSTGEIKTFYTRQFENTTPLLFQIKHIFPYALGWPIFLLGSLGLLLMLITLVRQTHLGNNKLKVESEVKSFRKNSFGLLTRLWTFNFGLWTPEAKRGVFIITVSFLSYLIPNGLLFAKWTRFMTPIFPFFAIFAAYLWYQLSGIRYQDRQCLHQKTALFREAAVSVGKGFYPLPSNTRIFLISQIKTLVKSLKNWRRAGDLSQHHLAAFGGLEVRDPELLSSAKRSKIVLGHPKPFSSHRVLDRSATSAVYSPPRYIISILLILLSILPGLFFFQIYTKPDVRLQASKWIFENIPDGSYLLSETGNVVDIPLRITNYELRITNYGIVNFDFYHLNENPALLEELVNHLERADYILTPSRRIFANHLRLPETYPITSNYYQALFDGRLGFEPVQVQTYKGSEQPADAEVSPKNRIENLPRKAIQEVKRLVQIFTKRVRSFSKFSTETHERRFLRGYEAAAQAASGQLVADEAAEETWTVFDHPVVRIFKKITPHDKLYYQNILKSI